MSEPQKRLDPHDGWTPQPEVQEQPRPDEELSPVRRMYKRLAAEYQEQHPAVPDCRGGVPGDLIPW